ncbi:uncharacterized protein BT62DRAFT_922405 [Guyanagaster necrorhizus]|uniref:Uncharacterized protein n=1 Tax=Guyanagaster necrorhizus TaxID=856835 RepID=A0A9P8AQB2_9AGAR|nr:uncharacterized protein BT62DRAFT_922405 [Guyanagaster necrorhizus MCA 3950]KAG7442687.1 hypothetical protein BT62DRAFT_922405 [Guyanagaster necrorhizus MCA 3950]
MSGLIHNLCSAENITTSDDWSMSLTQTTCHALKNLQDSMVLDGEHIDGNADEHATANQSPANELSTGDNSVDHSGVGIGQDAEAGHYMLNVTAMQPPFEIASDTGHQKGVSVMPVKHSDLIQTGDNIQEEELTSVQLSTI